MLRKKILWLASWYPNKLFPFDGDFIQRHAYAASLYNDIYVIHLVKDEKGVITDDVREQVSNSGSLVEHIIYFKKSMSFSGKFFTPIKWISLFRRSIMKYLIDKGRPDLVHVHVPFKAGIIALWIRRKYKVPFIVTEHWGIYNDVIEENYSAQPFLVKNSIKRILKSADEFLTVSQYLGNAVNNLVIAKQYAVIPNVVNTEFFFYKNADNQIFRFIHVSNMVPLKNAEGILRVVKSLVERNLSIEMVMVGDSDPGIRKYAEQLGLLNTAVFFRGEIEYKRVAEEMKQSQCLVLFSDIENSPCVIAEALCCGLPVIATKTGGIPELLNSSNSILIDPRNEIALAAAMDQLMSDYEVFDRKDIAAKAKNKFSYPVIGKMFDQVYGRLVSGNHH